MSTAGQGERFRSLDAIRGLAALSVVLFHSVNAHPDVTGSALGRALLYGWAGVFLFFPVSGYCICAAMDRRENGSVGRFLARRWRRIFPPYWASLVLTIVIGLAALPFNRGSLSDFMLPAHLWAALITLTQVFTSRADAINPVYWSLGYEEQFYLVMAAALLMTTHWRAAVLAAVTALAVGYLVIVGPVVTGLFLNFWVSFAIGCAVYFWLRRPEHRLAAAIILGLAIVLVVVRYELALAVSVAGAGVMLVIARVDERLMALRAARPLIALGTISFSLYLTHVPVAGRITNLLVRFDAPMWAAAVVATAASVIVAWAFYALVERRWLPSRSRSTAAVGVESTQLGAPMPAAGRV